MFVLISSGVGLLERRPQRKSCVKLIVDWILCEHVKHFEFPTLFKENWMKTGELLQQHDVKSIHEETDSYLQVGGVESRTSGQWRTHWTSCNHTDITLAEKLQSAFSSDSLFTCSCYLEIIIVLLLCALMWNRFYPVHICSVFSSPVNQTC